MKKENNPIKKWAKNFDISPKKYRWPVSNEKMLNISDHQGNAN